MRCRRIRPLLLDYADDRLPREQRSLVARHLESCQECSRAADDLAQARRWTALAPSPQPRPDFSQRVLAAIERGPVVAPTRPKWRFVFAAAALAVTLLLGGIFGYHRLHTPAPTSAQPEDLKAFVDFCTSNHSTLPESESLLGADDLFVPADYAP